MPAISVHHTATVDEAWDGPAAVAAMPNDDTVLHYCMGWESAEAASTPHEEGDSDADDQKGNYKFPHHRTKGGPANVPACRNGLARLPGASIPDADRAGVEAHLRAHLKDAGADGEEGASDRVGFPIVDEGAWSRAVRLGNLASAERVKAHAARVQRASDRQEFFRFSNSASSSEAFLDIYDEIGFWGVSARDFTDSLRSVSAPSLTVHINSPGGDVFDGIAILNALRSHPATVHVVVDGLAASAASFIAMAGDTVTMMPNSNLMIHDASGVCMGNQADMASMADLLDKMSDNIASIYAARTGTPRDQWRDVMRGEQWYSADEAVTAGLADRVADTGTPSKTPVENRWNFSFFNYDGREHAPAPVLAARVEPFFTFDPEVFRDAIRVMLASSTKESGL